MTLSVCAELSPTGREIILAAGGRSDEMAKGAAQLELTTPLWSPTKPEGGLQAPVSWPAVIQLLTTFGAAWSPGPRLAEWIEREIRARTSPAAALTVPVPEGLTPFSWQPEGALMLAAARGGLITDDPGTGKTITAILALREMVAATPAVVVCPASVVDSWVEALRLWAPEWRTVAWRGTPVKRRALSDTADVYVCSYDTCRQDAQASSATAAQRTLVRLGPVAVVLDECHLIKTPDSMRSLAARRLTAHARYVIALSGTPITHHPGDLWATLEALAPEAWPARERWVARYCQATGEDYSEQIIGLEPLREPEFRACLLGQHRRVAKADVLAELPSKVYSLRSVDLPSRQRKAYDEMESQMLAELPNGEELSAMSVLSQLTRLSQLASATAEVEITYDEKRVDEYGNPRKHVKVHLHAPSWKVDALLEVLAERPGQPVVAFAPSRQLMMLAGDAASKAGLSVGYIVGGQTAAERTETVETFQAGKLDLLCATTGAGGVGITLTAARTAVFLQRPWSIVESIQAEDRIHRIGSERHDSIEIIDIIAADTIDTRVRETLRDKAGQLSDLVQDPRIVAELLGGANVKRRKAKAA